MSDRETEEFLAARDHGVLSLGVENRGYGFPISYTYDPEDDRIVLGFVNTPGGKKQEFATETDEATFTVYTHEDVDSWEGVVATGPIRPVEDVDDSYRVPDLFFNQEGDDADDQMVNLDEFDRTWYELRIDTLSGRRSGE